MNLKYVQTHNDNCSSTTTGCPHKTRLRLFYESLALLPGTNYVSYKP